MKRNWRGFTLVEVSLFLAITAAIFVGIAVGTQNSIFQQRYNDAVQSFAEFLRTVYSQVTNVQNESAGRSDKAIYGKLVTFNEGENGSNKITSYNVIGEIGDFGGGNVLSQLSALDANVVIDKDGEYRTVGFVEDYRPRWGSQIQTGAGWDDGYKLFTGALLIVRHPSSGTVYTFSTGNSINIEGYLETLKINPDAVSPLVSAIDDNQFTAGDVDFCVNPNGAERSNLRRDVRIVEGARNASGIEIMPDGKGCD